MKNIILMTTTTTICLQASALLNLRNHKLLGEKKITPFETLAYIETFDEVPIFGGEELR